MAQERRAGGAEPVAELGPFLRIHPYHIEQHFWRSAIVEVRWLPGRSGINPPSRGALQLTPRPATQGLWLKADFFGGILGIATNVILVRFVLARLAGASWPMRLYFLHVIFMQVVLLVGPLPSRAPSLLDLVACRAWQMPRAPVHPAKPHRPQACVRFMPLKYIQWRRPLVLYSRVLRLVGSTMVWPNLPDHGAPQQRWLLLLLLLPLLLLRDKPGRSLGRDSGAWPP
jgi:hypothetical protein